MALRDTIQLIVNDMSRLQGYAASLIPELDVNAFEGFSDPSITITTELGALVTARKTIDKNIVGIGKKIRDAVKTNLDTL